jgi:ABC-type glycerol-3-phosphate transport system substrate-binding protein
MRRADARIGIDGGHGSPRIVDALRKGNLNPKGVRQEHVWTKAIHRVATEDVSPEQAVDEAIARIKQILSE